MKYTIEVNHKKKIIFYKHKGKLNTDKIGLAWQEFLKLEEFTQKKYNLLSDYSEAAFDMTESDVQEIIGFLSNIKNILKDKKQALILSEPISTALSLLFSEEVTQKIGFKVEVFSTKSAALNFLEI